MSSRRRLTQHEVEHARALARKLKQSGSVDPGVLTELGDIFAQAAVHLQSPAKSFVKRIPHVLGDQLSRGQVDAVVEAAKERVRILRREETTSSRRDLKRLLTLDEVAPLLGLTASVMEKLLVDWEFRRDCGWPQWVRGRWFFHPEAFGPRKPEYFSRMPGLEPYPTPPHCERQPADESGS